MKKLITLFTFIGLFISSSLYANDCAAVFDGQGKTPGTTNDNPTSTSAIKN